MPLGEYILYCASTTQRSIVSLGYLEDGISDHPGTTFSDFFPFTPSETPRTSSDKTGVAPPHSGGLAAPAMAGIGVAVGVVVVGAIAALGVCLIMRKRKRKHTANQSEEIPTGPSNPPMQQGNPGQGWLSGAPISSPNPNSQTAFLKSAEQPSPPYSIEPASSYNPHFSSLASPVAPYDSHGPTGSTGQYPLSENPSATASPKNTISPSLMSPAMHKPGEIPRFDSSPDHTAQPPSPISAIGHHGGVSRLGSPINNQVHEISTGSSLHNNPRGSVTSQSPPYYEAPSSVASPTRGNSGTQSPPPLHPIHEAPQAYHDENQAHGMVSSPTSGQEGPGAYYERSRPSQEFSAGAGGGGGGSNGSILPSNDMSTPSHAASAVIAPTPRNNSETYEGQKQAQYDIHGAPTTSYTAYSPGASLVTRGPLEVYHNNNAQ